MNADLFDLSGKVAVVTGGAGIIGSRVCAGLAAYGASVAVVDINEEAARDLANQIGDKALAIKCDVGNPDSVDAMVNAVTEQFGDIDILHNNAAKKCEDLQAFFAPYEDYSLKVWRDIMDINLDGMFLVSQAVGKRMVKRGQGGSIIQTSSIYGVVAPDQRIYAGSEYMGVTINSPAVYAASKAAVIGLTSYLAAYWGDQGIRVNTLVPGGVASGQNDMFTKKYSAKVPMGRMAEANEMVGAVVFLASDASSYVTGQILAVDGGFSTW
jgi:NAD(P)-dependent dehydrogenase (short-subunit alcohol dehydrogenase family)